MHISHLSTTPPGSESTPQRYSFPLPREILKYGTYTNIHFAHDKRHKTELEAMHISAALQMKPDFPLSTIAALGIAV